jgi:hypothetical protein
MGDRLTHRLGGRCHSVDMLGGSEGKVNQGGNRGLRSNNPSKQLSTAGSQSV